MNAAMILPQHTTRLAPPDYFLDPGLKDSYLLNVQELFV
jgi:hypothetical protein